MLALERKEEFGHRLPLNRSDSYFMEYNLEWEFNVSEIRFLFELQAFNYAVHLAEKLVWWCSGVVTHDGHSCA